MKVNKFSSVDFVVAITAETSKLIAANDHISVKAAKEAFEKSKVFDYLCNPPDYFYEEDPQYFFEMYENLKNEGIMLDNTDLYLKNHPELYSLDVD